MVVTWVQKFARLTPEEKLPVMEMLSRVARDDFPAIARLEAGSGSAEIDRFLAEALGQCPDSESLRVLEHLSESVDTPTRLAAEHSLQQLHASHPDLLAEQAAESMGVLGPYFGAYQARDDVTGQLGVVLARLLQPKSIVFCIALIDLKGQGIVDLWGNAGFSPDEFANLLQTLNAPEEQENAWIYRPADPAEVASLLRQAEQTTRLQQMTLPPGFNLWSHLWQET